MLESSVMALRSPYDAIFSLREEFDNFGLRSGVFEDATSKI